MVHLHLAPAPDGGPRRVLLARSAPTVATALRGLRQWFAAQPQCAPMPVPDSAQAPVYSTWYAFNQRVDAASVEAEARVAASLGCEVLILDDGWQKYGSGRGYAGCGDWRPDPTTFPDFAAHVSAVRAQGLRYLAWVAPLLLGPDADCAERLTPYAPAPAGVPGAQVLDPRRPRSATMSSVCAPGWSPTTASTGSRSTFWTRPWRTAATARTPTTKAPTSTMSAGP
ncbi:alpha-galactosidase [Streptomyces avermitilis]|uniref:alpha-galactosidase n=1 Tax=Streptomyces avermitilis TaxID=33903 RepID=UPI002118A8E5|nr:alpha-galactosidase [Streptomyces avermitilis]